MTYPAATDDALDWLGVYVVSKNDLVHGCGWRAFTDLDAIAPVIPYQAEALAWYRAGLEGRRTSGSFERPDMLRAVRAWVASHIDGDRALTGRFDVFRMSATEAVIRFHAKPAPVYFKAGDQSPFRDAALARVIQRVASAAMPRTLASDDARGWWLVDHVRGIRCPAQWDDATALRVIDTVGSLQHILERRVTELTTAGAFDFSQSLLAATLDDILRRCSAETCPRREFEKAFAITARALGDWGRPTWNHGDLADQNIGVSDEAIVFIDEEAAAVGPSLLSVPKLARTCSAATRTTGWFRRCLEMLDAAGVSRTAPDIERDLRIAAAVTTLTVGLANLHHRFDQFAHPSSLNLAVTRAAQRAIRALRQDLEAEGYADLGTRPS